MEHKDSAQEKPFAKPLSQDIIPPAIGCMIGFLGDVPDHSAALMSQVPPANGKIFNKRSVLRGIGCSDRSAISWTVEIPAAPF